MAGWERADRRGGPWAANVEIGTLPDGSVPRLAGYFLWLIYLQQWRSGAYALNLGGSETASLHQFKTHTLPEHVLQATRALQHPGTPHREGTRAHG